MRLPAHQALKDFLAASRRAALPASDSTTIEKVRRPRISIYMASALAVVLALSAPLLAHAYTAGKPIDLAFPRSSIWWPDPKNQSLDDIARHDYVILDQKQGWAIAPLKARNPDIIVLAGASACVLPLHTEPGAQDSANSHLLNVPNQWFLTQVGARLTSSVNGSATLLPVGDVSAFRVGDVVVIENELAKVEGIGRSSIRVRRGLIPSRSPATSHPAGTRAAAIVCFWPGRAEMDLSTNCPKVTVDPKIGPETWGDYNARTAAAFFSEEWDGLAVDRVDGLESNFLGRPLARTIDPNRSNLRTADNYSQFLSSWRAGLRRYESLLRTKVPGDKILFSNVAKGNFDLLNGTNLEGFPKAEPRGLSTTWPYWRYWQDGLRSYLEALRLGRQPNLSSVTTYYDDSEPSDTTAETPYNNTFSMRQTDYRRMRLGLGTALLGDGFFDYEVSTQGHGRAGLAWFDEYDNAGTNRRYLGKPLGSARLALPPLASPDLLGGDGSLSTQQSWTRWYTWANPGYAASQSADGGTAHIRVTASAGKNVNAASFCHNSVALRAGTVYTLSFRARSDRPLSISARISKPTTPYTSYAYFDSIALGTTWRTYEMPFISRGSDSAARLAFGVGLKVGSVWLDDISVRAGLRSSTYRRDYDGGVALVNASDSTATIDLGGTYRRIRGTQDPVTNNGNPVRVVAIPARDGLVVIGESSTLSARGGGTIAYRGTKRIQGALKGRGGRLLAGRRVALEQAYAANSTRWTSIATASTTASGTYSFTVSAARTTFYRVRFAGDSGNVGSISPMISLACRVHMPLPSVPTVGRAGRGVAVSGFLKPRQRAAVQLQCYRLEGSSWVLRKTVWARTSDYSSSYSRYSASVVFPSTGSWRIRTCRPADGSYAETYSDWRRIYVSK